MVTIVIDQKPCIRDSSTVSPVSRYCCCNWSSSTFDYQVRVHVWFFFPMGKGGGLWWNSGSTFLQPEDRISDWVGKFSACLPTPPPSVTSFRSHGYALFISNVDIRHWETYKIAMAHLTAALCGLIAMIDPSINWYANGVIEILVPVPVGPCFSRNSTAPFFGIPTINLTGLCHTCDKYALSYIIIGISSN